MLAFANAQEGAILALLPAADVEKLAATKESNTTVTSTLSASTPPAPT